MSRSTEVKIDVSLMQAIEAIPVRSSGNQRKEPTPEQVEALRRYWRSGRRQDDMSKALGVSRHTAARWYEEYVEADGKNIE